MLHIERVVVGRLEENCYILWNDGEAGAVIVDPGDEAEKIDEQLKAIARRPAAVLLTHGHFDHTGALSHYAGLPIYLHEDDGFMLNDPTKNVGWRFSDFRERPTDTIPVREGERFALCGITFEVLHTPGHTPGCVCYLADGEALLTGDTLFRHGYGRVDHPGGDIDVLFGSLKRLLGLPRDYPVYPGHGEGTSVFQERGRL